METKNNPWNTGSKYLFIMITSLAALTAGVIFIEKIFSNL